MKGYKYLVWGEDKQKVKSDPLEYKVRLEVTNRKKFITTNKVWEHNGVLLGERNKSNDLKDLCLAFALFKLLRRRFFGLPIHEANKQKTKELVLKGLIQNKNYDRAFEIIAAELAFLNDFFFTRYPVIFARGFPFLRLALSLSVIGVALYLTVIFYHSSGRLADYLSKTSNGIAVTWILLLILAVKEFCEMVFYVMSDWTKVVLISNYVQKPLWRRCTPIVCLAKLLCNCKIVKMRWHGILWQYNLLQSFRYKVPQLSGFPLYTWTPRVFYKHLPGYQGSPRNTFLKEVKEAICKSLKELCEKPEDLDKYLSRVANSHHEHLDQKIPLTSEFATETQKILVWHLATCYCEIKLAKTSQNTQTQSEYKAATALSQYSAHLLVWCSHLLPGRSLVATRLFKYTLEETRNLLVGSCKSWGDVVDELENLVKENDGGKDETKVSNDHKDAKEREQNLSKRDRRRKKGPFQQDSVLSKRDRRRKKEQDRARVITNKIIRVGVKLGGSLFALLAENGTGDDTKLWKFLEEFWARYLLHLAALVSPDDHKKLLSEGGEFLTHVWALLSHAGVLVETEQDPPSLSSSN
ncbi:hypothetical protein FCM35_KLT17115 [Carex littledalei]|uniref:DUF4220 domain-containing protein n=1 Tax=Carex littledalei TaxID=544730 RepID=A0A833VWG6_9POAL|nr:hypothetical protein FCM35_KLT17115 [Carex littledalei]